MDGFRTLLTRLQEFKDVKEKIESLEPQLDRFKQIITAATGGDPGEIERRAKLTRYARQLFSHPPNQPSLQCIGKDRGAIAGIVSKKRCSSVRG